MQTFIQYKSLKQRHARLQQSFPYKNQVHSSFPLLDNLHNNNFLVVMQVTQSFPRASLSDIQWHHIFSNVFLY